MDSSREPNSGCGWIFLILAVVGLCLIPFVGLPIALVLAFAAIFGRVVQSRLEGAEKRQGEPEAVAPGAEAGSGDSDEPKDDGIASPS